MSTPSPPVAATQHYVIQRDDTLSKIAKRIYGDERRWAELYFYNRHVIGGNANTLTIGTRLELPPNDFRLSAQERGAIFKTAARAQTLSATPPAPNATRNNIQQARTTPAQQLGRNVVAFFIGGAGDKDRYYLSGPNRNIVVAQRELDSRITRAGRGNLYQSHYLGYKDVRGSDDIKKHVLDVIPNKSTPIYIIGHSLGAWNGAHLSEILTNQGYSVAILVTLDPVGEGSIVQFGSDIYTRRPTPKAGFWVNIRATPKNTDVSDGVANFGEQWIVRSGPNMNYTIDANHYNAGIMFRSPLGTGQSAADLVFNAMVNYMGRR